MVDLSSNEQNYKATTNKLKEFEQKIQYFISTVIGLLNVILH